MLSLPGAFATGTSRAVPMDQDGNDNGPGSSYDAGTFNFRVWANCNWAPRVIK